MLKINKGNGLSRKKLTFCLLLHLIAFLSYTNVEYNFISLTILKNNRRQFIDEDILFPRITFKTIMTYIRHYIEQAEKNIMEFSVEICFQYCLK